MRYLSSLIEVCDLALLFKVSAEVEIGFPTIMEDKSQAGVGRLILGKSEWPNVSQLTMAHSTIGENAEKTCGELEKLMLIATRKVLFGNAITDGFCIGGSGTKNEMRHEKIFGAKASIKSAQTRFQNKYNAYEEQISVLN